MSIAKDMKSTLRDGANSGDVPRDVKGRKIISPEEKAKRVAAEVPNFVSVIYTSLHYVPHRKLL